MTEEVMTSATSRPIQKLSIKKKGRAWVEANIKHILNRAHIGDGSTRTFPGADMNSPIYKGRIYRMQKCYDAYNSEWLKEEFEYLTNPFGLKEDDVDLPTVPQNVNILRPAIDLLIGEKIKRPFRFTVIETSPEMVSYLEDYKKQMIVTSLIQQVQNMVQGEETYPTQSLEEIENFMSYTVKNVYERAGQLLLNKYRKELNIDDTFVRAWKDALLAGEAIVYTGDGKAKPEVSKVNPIFCDFERHPDMERIEEASWFVRRFWMPVSKCLDTFELTPTQIKTLAEKFDLGVINGIGDIYDTSFRLFVDTSNLNGDNDLNVGGDIVTCHHFVWRSWEKIGYLKREDEGNITLDIVGEEYVAQEGETIEWDWKGSIWESYLLDDDIVTDYRQTDYTDLPYYGNLMNNTNTRNVSLAELIMPLQALYMEIVYRLLLTIARDKGKVLNMEMTSIPTSLGIDTKKWMHYLSFVGINFMNQNDEGWDQNVNTPNRSAHLSSSDLTMASVINEYIGIMNKIEDLVGSISGVSKQRQGVIAASELVGNVERSILQSNVITEHWFQKMNDLEKRVYNALLMSCQRLIEKGSNAVMIALDDISRQFMTIPDGFKFADLNVYISDSSEDMRKSEAMRGLAQHALAAGASLAETAELFISDNVADMKVQLRKIDAKRQEMEQQRNEQAQKIAEMNLQARQAEVAETNAIKREEIAAKIQVAMINNSGEEAGDQTMMPEDNSLEETKVYNDMTKFYADLEQRRKEHSDEMALKNKELKIKAKQPAAKKK